MAEVDGKKEVKMDAEALKVEMERRKQATEEAKRLAELKKTERQQVINEKVGEPRILDGLSETDLRDTMNQYIERLLNCESSKYDLERKVMANHQEIHDLKKKVMDLRGKFIIPELRKVSMEFEDLATSKED